MLKPVLTAETKLEMLEVRAKKSAEFEKIISGQSSWSTKTSPTNKEEDREPIKEVETTLSQSEKSIKGVMRKSREAREKAVKKKKKKMANYPPVGPPKLSGGQSKCDNEEPRSKRKRSIPGKFAEFLL